MSFLELVHGIPFSPTAQTAKNVEFVIICSESEKPRVLHAKHVVRGKKRVTGCIIRFILSVWLYTPGGRNRRGSYSQICFCQKKLDI